MPFLKGFNMEILRATSEKDKSSALKLANLCFKKFEKLSPIFQESGILNDCFICKQEGNIISCLYTINRKIIINNKILNLKYIYAACTHPLYRNKGCMAAILNYVQDFFQTSGKIDALCLKPGNDTTLKKYYSKFGYKDFFKTRFININKTQMEAIHKNTSLIHPEFSGLSNVEVGDVENICRLIYNKNNKLNKMLYDKHDIIKIYKIYKALGGEAVTSDSYFTICYPYGKKELLLLAFEAEIGKEKNLLAEVFEKFPFFEDYIVCTHPCNNLFKNNGNVLSGGMIKPLNSTAKNILESIPKSKSAYMAFTLDY